MRVRVRMPACVLVGGGKSRGPKPGRVRGRLAATDLCFEQQQQQRLLSNVTAQLVCGESQWIARLGYGAHFLACDGF